MDVLTGEIHIYQLLCKQKSLHPPSHQFQHFHHIPKNKKWRMVFSLSFIVLHCTCTCTVHTKHQINVKLNM